MTPKQFFAFISYKREDSKWAEWLQKKLEHYRLPSGIWEENKSAPKELRPIFRDTSELSAGVLSDSINLALDGSRFLIVICSPRAVKSEWVNKEVQAFIDAGKVNCIIPFVIDGEVHSKDPDNECLPKALQGRARQVQRRNGRGLL